MLKSADKPIEKVFDFSDFTKIDQSLPLELIVSQGPDYSVSAEIYYSNLLENADISVKNGTLRLKAKPNVEFKRLRSDEKVAVFHITMPDLTSLSVSSSGRFIMETPLETSEFNVNVSGAATLQLKDLTCREQMHVSASGAMNAMFATIKCKEANVRVSGAAQFSGNTIEAEKSLKFKSSGAGNFSVENVVTDDMAVIFSGAANFSASKVTVKSTLTAEGSGSSDIQISDEGSAAECVLNFSGSSSFRGENFKATRATINSSGSSSVNLGVSDHLVYDCSGRSEVTIDGSPQTDGRASGSSRFRTSGKK